MESYEIFYVKVSPRLQRTLLGTLLAWKKVPYRTRINYTDPRWIDTLDHPDGPLAVIEARLIDKGKVNDVRRDL